MANFEGIHARQLQSPNPRGQLIHFPYLCMSIKNRRHLNEKLNVSVLFLVGFKF
jgi:hypothetical protein